MSRKTLIALAMAALAAPLSVAAQTSGGGWSFSVMPYLWLPSIDGALRFGPPPPGGVSANVGTDPDSYLDSLDFALMLTGTARKDRWVLGSDLIYLHFSNTDAKVKSVDHNLGPGPFAVSSTTNASVGMDLKGLVWQLAGGYAVAQEKTATVDVFGGVRYLGLDASTNANLTVQVNGAGGREVAVSRGRGIDRSDNIWAGIVGARGRFGLGDSPWFANAYVDLGGGSSTFTWQGIAGLGYAFKWGDVILDYRYLSYNASGSSKLIDEVSFGGLALGANFRF